MFFLMIGKLNVEHHWKHWMCLYTMEQCGIEIPLASPVRIGKASMLKLQLQNVLLSFIFLQLTLNTSVIMSFACICLNKICIKKDSGENKIMLYDKKIAVDLKFVDHLVTQCQSKLRNLLDMKQNASFRLIDQIFLYEKRNGV